MDDPDAEARFEAAVRSGDEPAILAALGARLKMYEEQGADALAAILHPDFELQTVFLEGRTYRGIDGLRQWREESASTWASSTFDPQSVLFADGDRVGVSGRLHCIGNASGAELDIPFSHVYEFREGKLYRLRLYTDTTDALAAAASDAQPGASGRSARSSASMSSGDSKTSP